MTRKHQLLLLGLLLFCFQERVVGQTNQLPAYDDAAAYEVYSAVLSLPETSGSRTSKNYVIRGETLRNFGAFSDTEEWGTGTGICLRPDRESEKVIGSAIADFERANKTKWRLLDKFKLQIPYQLVSSEKAILLIQKEGWDGFYKKYPDSGGFVDLSAVGFNADKTVAIVSKGGWCGDLCGSGAYYVVQKKDGKWEPLDWKGERCNWIS